jgi:hypothetical protein
VEAVFAAARWVTVAIKLVQLDRDLELSAMRVNSGEALAETPR